MKIVKEEIVYKSLDEIKEYENNPRQNDEAVEYVANSIKEFGFRNPIILDKDNVIIAGHTRYKASQQLKLKEVPCIYANDLTEEQVKAFRLADNKVGEIAEWDDDLLKIELDDILDIDMSDLGFDDIDLDVLDEETEVTEDEFDGELKDEVTVQKGDIYKLGRHRLMCGDSTSIKDMQKLMNNNKADMVFTDPPYGINYSGGRSDTVKKKKISQVKNDDLEGERLKKIICNIFKFNKEEADIYICVSPLVQKPFLEYIEENQKEVNAVIVWDKKIAGLGYMAYRRRCEFILFIKGAPFKMGDKTDFDLWSINKDNTQKYIHPTQKPIKVPARAIENSSKKDDIVLDMFGGSGSTLLACEQLKRKCYTMELEPKYVDAIIRRWEELTGEKAELIERR